MNEKILNMLDDMATFEDFNKRTFPAKAYRTAIKTIQGLNFEIEDAEQVKGMPGIGEGIYNKIDAFLKIGTFPRYEDYLKSTAAILKDFLKINGVGMETAKKLYNFGYKSLAEFQNAIKDKNVGDRLDDPNGKLSPILITTAMKKAYQGKSRMALQEHNDIVLPMLEEIKKLPTVKRVAAAGSARRYDGSEGYTVGDADLIVGVDTGASGNFNPKSFNPPKELLTALESLLDDVIVSGPTKISGSKNGRQVDIRITDDSVFGSLLLHATGPMQFNIACRKIAESRGWKLNEYGLFDMRKNPPKCIAKEENEILDKLGVPEQYRSPAERGNFKA